MTDRDQFARQIERLVSSRVLHSSESLCKLLKYLAKHALDYPGKPLKEYQIATEVFGRPPDFDPQLDSTIRVQAGRLRAKLAEYYSGEGADEPTIVDLPKGTYILSFHHRSTGSSRMYQAPDHEVVSERWSSGEKPKNWVAAVTVLSVLLAASVALIVDLLLTRKHPDVIQADASETVPPAALRTFWKPFLTGQEVPLVIFSNAAFIGRPETGMRYHNPADDPNERIFDHYTGVGEVLAVHNLDSVFGLFHRQIVVKRGSLFSLDDAKNNDLIFVGSPSENLTLQEIPGTREFVFQRLASGPRKGDLAIVNVHPAAGEATAFLASPSGAQLVEDYAVVSMMQGFNSSHTVMILAGTTTFGTQGAVEYVCRARSIEDLLLRLSVSNGNFKPFEALVRVKIAHGVPVDTELVAVRERTS
jgi:hypothetical protein